MKLEFARQTLILGVQVREVNVLDNNVRHVIRKAQTLATDNTLIPLTDKCLATLDMDEVGGRDIISDLDRRVSSTLTSSAH